LLRATLVALLLTTMGAVQGSAENRPVNVNTASVEELVEVNGIGNAKAQAIIAYRDQNGPFGSVDDLRQVSGIGAKILERIRPQVTTGADGVAAPPAPAQR
jgi:competence protein ComEA